ncbi:hypothetical protein F5J12DRAFT_892710 [Pisolithus orientalis]|uniref:uncharacterized protein n=1 Tax=Pisolithus orientalis TaxID=936130 RepID=UPI0022255790|nr:uncharacterized protein F5J12DRAFT_892710 [Pisolithus orientalis]KAI6006512.1 hypothetical protein F5J12DRAFT_892710 [Pisolithus orientalis]
MTSANRFVDNASSSLPQITFYASIPFGVTFLLVELLITVSLCVLLYDSGSHSAFPRTKRLLNTLIIYAVNRCLLTLLVALAEFATSAKFQSAWSTGLDFTIGKLYANSLLASLNTRQILRAQQSGTRSDERISGVHLANLQRLSKNVKRSKDGEKHIEAL